MGFAKRKYEKVHLTFKCIKDTGKTKIWGVWNDDDEYLGKIRWYWAWRRYVFFPDSKAHFDADCLRTIANFIAKEMKKRKAKK